MRKTNNYSLYDIAVIGMLAAFCMVSTMIKIPYGNGAMVHLGTAALFTISILFGGKYAGFAGAIGSAFFDLLMGFSPYTVWSFFIKGLAGLITGSVAHSNNAKGKNIVKNILACVIGAVWTLLGYIIAWTAVIGRFETAILNIPSSLVTSAVGLVVAIPFSLSIRPTLEKVNILKK